MQLAQLDLLRILAVSTVIAFCVGCCLTSVAESRPGARKYSYTIWPHRAIPYGHTVSAQTSYGPLTCVGGIKHSGRTCHWGN
jgi:hypothetical protein